MTPKDKIKDQLNIVDIISNYIRLERSGNQYKARCPFHNEKTPSFYVSPQRNSYHCFGCNKGGDIFSFLQEIEHIEFYEALKTLAKQAGITIGEYNKEQNDNLYEIMESSCEFYQKSLQTSPTSKKYLHDRGLLDETINEYRIGFANNN
ncbi:MAG: CHC2 zinc finger domain-containing protein [Candidatus Pacebacteria bacterium]|nr:CHC2 zinc finger domain-containing protein [Candidatus Paceibacterota bacterium]